MIEKAIEKIKAADLVLVGIGEALDISDRIEKEEYYQRAVAELGETESAWMLPFLKREMCKKRENEMLRIYEPLTACLKEKNYFVVSLCQDGILREGSLDRRRLVEPCGGYERLQCSRKCTAELYPVPEGIFDQISRFRDGYEKNKPEEPLCPKCGSPLVFNNVNAENYAEEGYLEGWMHYRKWLQGTVNKNLFVLELGVGMRYPTVVRWPFEKIVFFNQKAELFRVHEKLCQVAEEIAERAHGICQKPEEFLMELYAK